MPHNYHHVHNYNYRNVMQLSSATVIILLLWYQFLSNCSVKKKSSLDSLTEMLAEYRHIVQAIPVVLLPLMKPFMKRVDEAFKPGITTLNWMSLNVDTCKSPVSVQIICTLYCIIFISRIFCSTLLGKHSSVHGCFF